jgi:hypothetical protein
MSSSSLYTRLYERVAELREAGFDPDRIVVPAEDWRDVKDRAEILDGEGVAGSDKTLVNSVRAAYSSHQSSARVIFEVDDGE